MKVNRTSCLGQYALECNLVLFSHAEVATEKHESESVMKREADPMAFSHREVNVKTGSKFNMVLQQYSFAFALKRRCDVARSLSLCS